MICENGISIKITGPILNLFHIFIKSFLRTIILSINILIEKLPKPDRILN